MIHYWAEHGEPIARRGLSPLPRAPTDHVNRISGVILAGGMARRMGGVDKGLVEYRGQPLIEHVLTALVPQVSGVIINANRNLERYESYGRPVVPDIVGEFAGPLAGMASGMQSTTTEHLVSVPCDSPLISPDLVARLYTQLTQNDAEISVAHDGIRMHPVFALMRTDLLPSILAFLNRGERKIDHWFGEHKLTVTDFSDRTEMFLNLNRPEDLEALQQASRPRE